MVRTDTGHDAINVDPMRQGTVTSGHDYEARLEYAQTALDSVATTAKRIVRSFYGRPASHNSFAGCSNGAAFDPAEMRTQMAAFNKMPDTVGTGKYPALKEEDYSLSDHVLYRQADLSVCRSMPTKPCPLPGPQLRHRPRRPPASPERSIWALKENMRPGSHYFGHINSRWIAVSAWTCGGLQALQVAAEPRVRAVLIHNSGSFNAGATPIPGMDLTKAALKGLHTPLSYMLGGPKDIAYAHSR
ncbi:MAG TPA: tannase/feruloyl esterase family alpha/beta hydrolase [Steroidobacteraceae bacterium]